MFTVPSGHTFTVLFRIFSLVVHLGPFLTVNLPSSLSWCVHCPLPGPFVQAVCFPSPQTCCGRPLWGQTHWFTHTQSKFIPRCSRKLLNFLHPGNLTSSTHSLSVRLRDAGIAVVTPWFPAAIREPYYIMPSSHTPSAAALARTFSRQLWVQIKWKKTGSSEIRPKTQS